MPPRDSSEFEVRSLMSPLRIGARYEESERSDVPADLVFVPRARSGLVAISSNVHDNPTCAEFRLASTQEQHAANLEKESRYQNALVSEWPIQIVVVKDSIVE